MILIPVTTKREFQRSSKMTRRGAVRPQWWVEIDIMLPQCDLAYPHHDPAGLGWSGPCIFLQSHPASLALVPSTAITVILLPPGSEPLSVGQGGLSVNGFCQQEWPNQVERNSMASSCSSNQTHTGSSPGRGGV